MLMMFESSTKRKTSPTMLFCACLIFMGASSTPLITLKSKLEFDSKYTISNLWNGTEDTISDASNKGGNEVIIYLTGNVNNDLLVQSKMRIYVSVFENILIQISFVLRKRHWVSSNY